MLKCAQRICVFAAAAVGLFAQTANTPVSQTRTSGVVGIGQGQTARLNVLNAVTGSSATAAVCAVTLTFYDAGGAVLKSSTVGIPAGQTGSLNLLSDADLALAYGQRKQIRAAFSLPAVPASAAGTPVPNPVCNPISTLEIFDVLTGRTDVVLGGMHQVTNETAAPVTSSMGAAH